MKKDIWLTIGEITKASGEQAQGIEQLNNTVSEMDRQAVTKLNFLKIGFCNFNDLQIEK